MRWVFAIPASLCFLGSSIAPIAQSFVRTSLFVTARTPLLNSPKLPTLFVLQPLKAPMHGPLRLVSQLSTGATTLHRGACGMGLLPRRTWGAPVCGPAASVRPNCTEVVAFGTPRHFACSAVSKHRVGGPANIWSDRRPGCCGSVSMIAEFAYMLNSLCLRIQFAAATNISLPARSHQIEKSK